MASPTSWGTDKGFLRFCGALGLEVEPFQRRIVREVFAGRRELLVLIPRGNGKTTLFAALALYHLLIVPKARVYLAASSAKQANVALGVVEDFVRSHKALDRALTIQPGYKQIHNRKLNGMIELLSSDADRAHGLQPTLVLVDELHAHQNDGLYVAFKTAMGKQPKAQLLTISTAGHDEERVLYRLREGFLEEKVQTVKVEPRLRMARNAAANSAMFEWAARDTDDLANPAIVKLCNPASFVTAGFLSEQIESPGLAPWEFARYHANVWTPTFESWLPPAAWRACSEKGAAIPELGEVILGVDVGLRKDTSAVVCIHQRDDLRWVVAAQIWKPTPDSPVDLAEVEQHIRDLADRYSVRQVVYDPWAFDRSAQMLESEGLMMVNFPANNARTVPASGRLYEAINRRELVHDGDPLLEAQVKAGVKMDTERGWRLAKAKSKKPMDALYALMLAFAQAEQATWDGPLVEVFDF